MKTTLQATGYPPFEVEYDRVCEATEMLDGDKRGVRVAFYMVGSMPAAWEVNYLTSWGIERPFTHAGRMSLESMHADERVRLLAKSILPPGAGFPAMPQFETRQRKLEGMMETLTLTALTRALKEVAS